MNRHSCAACAERYPIMNGAHHLPNGRIIACENRDRILALPIAFESSGDGREVVKLGVIMIGEIASNPGGRRVPFWVRITLPDVTTRSIPAGSMEQGRQIVADKVRDWIDAAGLVGR